MSRPLTLNDGRPLCLVPGCLAPRDLSCRYAKQDGTVMTSYRRWCSWHARHPHDSPNPAFQSVPEDAQCRVPHCTRKAREYRVIANARERPRKPGPRRREWDAAVGPTRLQPGEHRYAPTCSIHTARDLPGYVPVVTTPVPRLRAKRAPAGSSRKQAQEERRVETLAQGYWREEHEDRGSKTRSMDYFRKLARKTIAKLKQEGR